MAKAKRYHINHETGNPGECRAEIGNCPYADSEAHFNTPLEARNAYEKFRSIFANKQYETYSHPIKLDKPTIGLLNSINASGAQALIVGGAVRDALVSGITPKDVDIEVHGVQSMDELISLLQRNGYKVNEVGRKFGVLKTVLTNGMDIDISLPRRDNKVGKGHRGFEVEVDPSLTLADAAARRDYTINALYYDETKQTILDAHHGMEDWEAGQLRHVSDAFAEDPLRVIRGAQFASRFNLSMAPETVALSKSISKEFKTLTPEGIQVEFQKFFTKGTHPERGLEVLRATTWGDHFGMTKQWFKDNPPKEVGAQIQAATANARAVDKDPAVFGAAVILSRLPEDKNRTASLMLIGDKPKNQAIRLASTQFKADPTDPIKVKAWARAIASNRGITIEEWHTFAASNPKTKWLADTVAKTAKAEGTYAAPLPDLVTGKMVIANSNGRKPGPWVGKVQAAAAQAQDAGEFNDEASAERWTKIWINSNSFDSM